MFAGQDNHGNAVGVEVVDLFEGGSSTCDSSLPAIGDVSWNSYFINFGFSGDVTYLNNEYTFDSTHPPGCGTSFPDVSCTITFSMSPKSVEIQFSAWDPSHTIVDVDMVGSPILTSVDVGQKESCYGGCFSYPYGNVEFAVSAPEPGAGVLIVAAAVLLFPYIRRKRSIA